MPQPPPAAAPEQSTFPFASEATTPSAVVQLVIRLIGAEALPFDADKQQKMLVATVRHAHY